MPGKLKYIALFLLLNSCRSENDIVIQSGIASRESMKGNILKSYEVLNEIHTITGLKIVYKASVLKNGVGMYVKDSVIVHLK